MNFCAALFRRARDFHGRYFNAVDHFEQAVLHKTFGKFNLMHFAFAAHCEAQPLAERIHTAHAHAVQTARHFVTVLVELAAGVQFSECNF